jgi:hypothetical protein
MLIGPDDTPSVELQKADEIGARYPRAWLRANELAAPLLVAYDERRHVAHLGSTSFHDMCHKAERAQHHPARSLRSRSSQT